jgi:hypothetical protein
MLGNLVAETVAERHAEPDDLYPATRRTRRLNRRPDLPMCARC